VCSSPPPPFLPASDLHASFFFSDFHCPPHPLPCPPLGWDEGFLSMREGEVVR
jgi:hypothetical protein